MLTRDSHRQALKHAAVKESAPKEEYPAMSNGGSQFLDLRKFRHDTCYGTQARIAHVCQAMPKNLTSKVATESNKPCRAKPAIITRRRFADKSGAVLSQLDVAAPNTAGWNFSATQNPSACPRSRD